MVHVASEMERRKINIPLLVGGATTSEMHAAVKIAPVYSNPVIHVKDASKAAGVLAALRQNDNSNYVNSLAERYKKLRDEHSSRKIERSLQSLSAARQNKLITDWSSLKLFEPAKPGIHEIHEIDIYQLSEYIDWTFFFFAWKISGKYPAIFNDPVKGVEAKKLFDDAQKYLKEIVDKKLITAKAIFGLHPANSVEDDVNVFSNGSLEEPGTTFRFLRNQEVKEKGTPNLSLSDYIAPAASGKTDCLGTFVVTAAIVEEAFAAYKDDDYATIMIRILSDRLAEAAAEWLHEKIRREYWGYAANEKLTHDEMLSVKYQGIRPAPGYPACPDHTEKQVLFDLLKPEKIGVKLTENFAMMPPASVSGYIFSHPASYYFGIAKIGTDQLSDYARRKKMTIEEASRWLAPNL
jgi:5-methyltetrahydrofolate--homocysteine methyltransferase